ncbi:pleckstrin homology domain-containing family A member 6-like isoform X5 [Polyodon spathula]|uniref:pleckstrin homology domain-containing family A member 6-like isoform X5 n=1 Tax=Polyodon spathula TaxID=7913 RepID=UPI001B7DA50B|nr:pleckstrin homology domain-containing family A member 6-like isoform X5 [Polyodon spathula]
MLSSAACPPSPLSLSSKGCLFVCSIPLQSDLSLDSCSSPAVSLAAAAVHSREGLSVPVYVGSDQRCPGKEILILKYCTLRSKRREQQVAGHNDRSSTFRHPVNHLNAEETHKLQQQLLSNPDMSGKRPVSITSESASSHGMVSDLEPNGRASRSSKKAVTFGKRSNSMRRNPKAEVMKQGWLYKQASNGVKQWNKRWFVLTDRCLFYYKDEKEEAVLGSIPLLSFWISLLQPSDNINRKHAFKASWCREEEGYGHSNGSSSLCPQAEHAGVRTYFFSAESQEDQETWVRVMSEAAQVHIQLTQSNDSENIPPAVDNMVIVAKGAEPRQRGEGDGRGAEIRESSKRELNGAIPAEAMTPPTPRSPMTAELDGRGKERGERRQRQPNGWGEHVPHTSAFRPQAPRDPRDSREAAVLRRGFVPRTQPERLAQRKSSMTKLQQWVNQRRIVPPPGDLRSPTRYYSMSPGTPTEYYGVYGPQFVNEFGMYPPGVRPDSICSESGFEGVPPHWAIEDRRRSLRDGAVYPQERTREVGVRGGYVWTAPNLAAVSPAQHPAYYAQLQSAQSSLHHLSLHPRSRSVPRSPSSSQGPYPPGSRAFSPVRSPSARFERGHHRDGHIYADPAAHTMRRSISSPKYEYPRDRRSITQEMYRYNYPASPSFQDKMEDILDLQLQRNLEYLDQQVSPYHEVYRDMLPAYKTNEIDIDKLLGQLCEQNRILKDKEATVQSLRVDKDGLEGALIATHQELDLYRNQPSIVDKLQLKKEALQNQLINIRGELSQASSNELLHRHTQKEFWRIQDVLEGLHKNNPSWGTDTAKYRATSRASGSFSTNSPASPLSSVSLTSPLSPFSPVSGSQGSPIKQVVIEDMGPPRPPLPKSYLPLESLLTTPPSVPPLPLENTLWLSSRARLRPDSEDEDERRLGESKFSFRSDTPPAEKPSPGESELNNQNKVGVIPPRTKSPFKEETSSPSLTNRRRDNIKLPNGHISQERPKSAVFPAEVKMKMSVKEQNERIKRHQSSSMREKRNSLQLSNNQQIDGIKPAVNYRVVRRRLTSHEVDIKDLEVAVRGQGMESPREEIARLRRVEIEPEHYNVDISRELSTPDKVPIPERYLDSDPDLPLSPDEIREKKKKVQRIKTLIAKSNLQNIVPLLDGPADGQADTEQQRQEQEKRIEISCALATEASRRSRLLSAQCVTPSPPTSPTDPAPPPIADLTDSSHFMKV